MWNFEVDRLKIVYFFVKRMAIIFALFTIFFFTVHKLPVFTVNCQDIFIYYLHIVNISRLWINNITIPMATLDPLKRSGTHLFTVCRHALVWLWASELHSAPCSSVGGRRYSVAPCLVAILLPLPVFHWMSHLTLYSGSKQLPNATLTFHQRGTMVFQRRRHQAHQFRGYNGRAWATRYPPLSTRSPFHTLNGNLNSKTRAQPL